MDFEQKVAEAQDNLWKATARYDAANERNDPDTIKYLNVIVSAQVLLISLHKEQRRHTYGGLLIDGIPLLQPGRSSSRPYIPSDKVHARCDRIVTSLPLFPIVAKVLNSTNTIWRSAKIRIAGGVKSLLYSSEEDIAYYIKCFLSDILFALQLEFTFLIGATIKHSRPDVYALLSGRRIVGIVKVVLPCQNVLLEPTVLGELLDHMLFVEGFYSMGPILGILTTLEEWVIAWFPANSEALARVDTRMTKQANKEEADEFGTIHHMDEAVDGSIDLLAAGLPREIDRILHTTCLLNIREDPLSVLQHLSSAFQLMARAHLNHIPSISRCWIKFHKDSDAVTFQPVSYGEACMKKDCGKFLNQHVKVLIAFEKLDRGLTGTVWLCAAPTQPYSACCVLKFDKNNSWSYKLRREMEMWQLLYPEFSDVIRLEIWSGSDALVMPYWSAILEHEREQYRDQLADVLTTHFIKKGKVYRDLQWENIGKYKKENGEIAVVIFSLNGVVDYNDDVHSDWIEKSMKSLFVNV